MMAAQVYRAQVISFDGWSQENRNIHNYSDCGGGSQLDDRNDAIGLGEFAVVDETTSNAEREHVRDSQTDCGAPHQAHDVPGDGSHIRQGG
jgi:hypothetical protein